MPTCLCYRPSSWMSRILKDKKDGQHLPITVLATECRHIWQGCYPVIQVWLQGLISDLQSVPCWLQIQFVFSGPAGPPVEPVTQQSAEVKSLCLPCCIMSLIKVMFPTSEKLMLTHCLFLNVKIGSQPCFFFVLRELVRALSPGTLEPGQPSSPVPPRHTALCSGTHAHTRKWLAGGQMVNGQTECWITLPHSECFQLYVTLGFISVFVP